MLRLSFSSLLTLQGLIPRLSADPHEPAGERYCESRRLCLRDKAANCFFVSVAPNLVFMTFTTASKNWALTSDSASCCCSRFELFNTLLGSQRDFGHSSSTISSWREGMPVELTVFMQPGHDGVAALNTITVLCLAVGYFTFFDLFDNGQFKG